MPIPVDAIQKAIQNQPFHLDGWLMYDFQGKNNLALEMLQIPNSSFLSRRFFYWIPRTGDPIKIHHYIEHAAFQDIPGISFIYSSWQEMQTLVEIHLKGKKTIAMEYSPMNAIPTISKVDAGMMEWIRGLHIEVVSSWPLLEIFTGKFTTQQKELHRQASMAIFASIESAKKRIQQAIFARTILTELDLQKHILEVLESSGYTTSHPPIVAVNEHSALPHYSPNEQTNKPVRKDDFILFDVWCKKNSIDAPYADHALVASVSQEPKAEIQRIYHIVKEAQESAIASLKEKLLLKEEVLGFEIDDVARGVIKKHGFGPYFTHRTGHNIFTEVHGSGVNLDNFETHDTRKLTANTCYSIEPGIYLPDAFGVRLECNVIINEDKTCEITGAAANELPCILRQF